VGLLSDREVRLYAMSSPEGRIVVVSGVVGAAMCAHPRVCGASTPIGVLAQTMINQKIDALPVVADGDGRRLLGIVTSVDLLWLLVDDELQERPIDVPARVGLPGALEARA
jgi:CBS domain-containing protein